MEKTSIEYIGKKPFFDRLYNTGLSFDMGQIRSIPSPTARLFLKHADLFRVAEQAEKTGEPKDKKAKDNTPADGEATDTVDDTEALLAEQAEKTAQKLKDENNLRDLYVQVSVMDKTALEQFAKDRYQHNIDKRKSVETLREEVVGLIDRFGAL